MNYNKNEQIQIVTKKFDISSLPFLSSEQLLQSRNALHDCFAYDNWSNMNGQDKMDCLQALENDFAYQQGRPALPVKEKIMDCYGYYSPYDSAIYINENLKDHGNFESNLDAFHPEMQDANIQLFDTIAHEGYHAYENYSMKFPEEHDDKHQLSEWAMNEGYYYDCSKENAEKYLIQPQERDAWSYGYTKTSEAFNGIEERNGMEPGRHEYEKTSAWNSYDESLSRAEYVNPNILSDMEEEMKSECEEKGISYDYENPNIVPTMVVDKSNYFIENSDSEQNLESRYGKDLKVNEEELGSKVKSYSDDNEKDLALDKIDNFTLSNEHCEDTAQDLIIGKNEEKSLDGIKYKCDDNAEDLTSNNFKSSQGYKEIEKNTFDQENKTDYENKEKESENGENSNKVESYSY